MSEEKKSIVRELLSDHAGDLSMMRVTASVIPLIIVGTWAYVCISNNQLMSFDFGDVAAVIGPLGAKAYQKGKEA